MQKSKKLNILYLLLVVCYIAIGVFVLIFANETREKNNIILGVLILLSSIPHLLFFVTQGGLKNSRKYPYLSFAIIGFAIGIAAMLNCEMQLDKICIIWGSFDICRSSFEITDAIPEIKEHNWLEFIEIGLSLGEIVVAILLIIDEFEGIKLHLVYFGVVFLVSAAKRIVDFLIKNLPYEKSSDRN